MVTIFLIILIGLVLFIIIKRINKINQKLPTEPFPANWRAILVQRINFYNALDVDEKKRFEYEVQKFLLNTKITGIETTVSLTDTLLVASGAIIPIFGFPEWDYLNLNEVILYPTLFNEKHETGGDDRMISGMVGNGYMSGKMILSKTSLHHGFSNLSDRQNVAIHEFTHLIDKADGGIDGIPKVLMNNQPTLPWFNLILKNIEEIYQDESDINPYGATDPSEFLPVATEYFFERPKLMQQKHPDLYQAMEIIFNQKMADRHLQNLGKQKPGRNSPCSCGSGKKYKLCCGR